MESYICLELIKKVKRVLLIIAIILLNYLFAIGVQTMPFTDIQVLKTENITNIRNVFNVRDYNAIGDGITDDRVAIQVAITAANDAGGGVVFFPKGTYYISSKIQITRMQNITIEGEGDCSVIVSNNISNNIEIQYSNNIKISNIKIDHSGTSRAVHVRNLCKYITFDNVTIDSTKNCLSLHDSIGVTVQNCRLTSTGDTCLLTRFYSATGSINSGSNQLVLASMPAADHTQWRVGDIVKVDGAGTSGADLVATITAINSETKTLTLNTSANTTVSNAVVRHYESETLDYAYGKHVFSNNKITQTVERPGIELWTGGNRVIGNTVLAPEINGGDGGITVGAVGDHIIAYNYIYGFGYGVEIGATAIPGYSGTEDATYGNVSVIGNIVRSCARGIATSTDSYPKTISIHANHVILTDEGSWSDRIGYYLGTRTSEITGGSVSYETTLPYTNSNSRKYKGVSINANIEKVTISNLICTNLAYGITGNGIREYINGCVFNNVTKAIDSTTDSSNVYIYVRDTVFRNVATNKLSRACVFRDCEFYNATDFISVNKAYAQFRTSHDCYCIMSNCRFTNVLDTCITASGNYYETGTGYSNPDIEIRDDYIKVQSTYTWIDIYNMFNTLGLPLQYEKEYLVYSDNRKYRYTQNGVVEYASISSDPSSGTWNIGDRIENTSPSSGGYIGKVCTTAGTQGTLTGVTGSINAGSNILTVNSATNLKVNMYITIAGVSGVKKITAIDGTTVTLDTTASATVSGATVSYSNAVFKMYGSIS